MSTRTVSKTIDLTSIPSDIAISKYITAIGNDGIKVHPYNTTVGQADTDNYVKIDSDSIEIWQKPEGASASIKVAEFDAGSIQIGSMAGYYVDIGSSGMSLANSNSNVFWAGANGVTYFPSSAAGGFRISKDGSSVNMVLSDTSRLSSSTATAIASNKSIAHGGEISYIDGSTYKFEQTEASGKYSFASGEWAVARGEASMAHGIGVLVEYEAQTAIGEYNDNDSNNVFEIGNGVIGTRSNALTVDWNGNTEQQGRAITEDMTTGSGSELEDFLSELNVSGADLETTQADWIVEQGITGDWTWRKWQSGIAECWGEQSFNNGGVQEKAYDITLPFNFANTSYIVTTGINDCGAGYQYACSGIGIFSKSVGTMQVKIKSNTSGSSFTYVCYLSIHGRWK